MYNQSRDRYRVRVENGRSNKCLSVGMVKQLIGEIIGSSWTTSTMWMASCNCFREVSYLRNGSHLNEKSRLFPLLYIQCVSTHCFRKTKKIWNMKLWWETLVDLVLLLRDFNWNLYFYKSHIIRARKTNISRNQSRISVYFLIELRKQLI